MTPTPSQFRQAALNMMQKMYEMINAGEVPHKLVGTRKLIPVDVAHQWAENLPDSAV